MYSCELYPFHTTGGIVCGRPHLVKCLGQWQTVHYLTYPTEILKCLKFPASEFGTLSMRRQFRTSTYEFLTLVTTGVTQDVNKVVILSSFGVIWLYEVS